MHVYTRPSQGNSLHSTFSTAEPLQFFPPQDGAGLLQFLIFSLKHEAKQFPTSQSDHPPSTIQQKAFSYLLYLLCIQHTQHYLLGLQQTIILFEINQISVYQISI